MSASQPGWFNFSALTDLGDLGDGMRLYTYAPNTTTHKVVWTDAAASVSHTYTDDGAGGNYLALNARGELPAPLFLTTGGYDLTLKTTAGATVWTRRAVGMDDSAATLDTALRAALASKASAAVGAGLAGFDPTLNYAAGTIGATFIEWNPKDFPWFAKFDGTTDDTAALQACWTAIRAAGGGTMVLPRGVTCITSLVLDYASSVTVNVRGAGQHATYLKKIGATTTPVLDIKSNTGVLDVYSKFSGFQVLGANACVGIRLTTIASLVFDHVEVRVCGVALDCVGALVNTFNNVSLLSNATGVKLRKSGAIYCNSLVFRDCSVRSNSALGFDIGDAMDLLVIGGHVESNGTSANVATGAVHILATIDDEVGLTNISFKNVHFEGNIGSNFVADAAAGLVLTLENVSILSSEGGRALNVGAIANVTLNNLIAASPGDVVTLAAAASIIHGGNIATITDTSSYRIRENVTTSGGITKFGYSACGSATLVAGVKAVAYPLLKTGEQIFVTSQADGGSPGWLRVSNQVADTGFTVSSSNAADTSTFGWFAVMPV